MNSQRKPEQQAKREAAPDPNVAELLAPIGVAASAAVRAMAKNSQQTWAAAWQGQDDRRAVDAECADRERERRQRQIAADKADTPEQILAALQAATKAHRTAHRKDTAGDKVIGADLE